MNFQLPTEFGRAAGLRSPDMSEAESDTDSDMNQDEALTLEMGERPIEAVLDDISYLQFQYPDQALDLLNDTLDSHDIDPDSDLGQFLCDLKESLEKQMRIEPETPRPRPDYVPNSPEAGLDNDMSMIPAGPSVF